MEVMIKELGTIITGNTPSKKNGEFWNSEDICFVKPDIISDNGVNEIFESNEYISKEAKKKAKKYLSSLNRESYMTNCQKKTEKRMRKHLRMNMVNCRKQ